MARRRPKAGKTRTVRHAPQAAAVARPTPDGGAGDSRQPVGSAAGRATAVPTTKTGEGQEDEPQALVTTHWFDSGDGSEPYSATVRFSGRRHVTGPFTRRQDVFTQDERVEGIVPGTGPVSITTWAYNVPAGEWSVTATLERDAPSSAFGRRGASGRTADQEVRPAAWSWRRWAVSAGAGAPVRTRWALMAPLARQPAVIPGIYTALGIMSIILAVVVQGWILGPQGVPVIRAAEASALIILAGLAGAKAWYTVLHPDESIIRGGWAVDGFLVVFPLVAALVLSAFELPIGRVLDASTPGIFLAVAIGRVGCFLTGCCAGRCTASRWGVWSSDRRVGARRIPTQLFESVIGLAIAVGTLTLVAVNVLAAGLVFLGAFAVYAVARQRLLRLRSEQRKSAWTLSMTAVASVLVVVGVAVAVFTQAG